MDEKLTTNSFNKVGEWNIADKYNKDEILELLNQCDKLRRIAIYGYDNMDDNSFITGPETRIEALNRYIDMLRNIIENSTFAVNKSEEKNLNKLLERIEYVSKYYSFCFYEAVDMVNKRRTIEINEPLFMAIVDNLRETKKELLKCIWSLIYPRNKDIDPKEMMDKIKRRGG